MTTPPLELDWKRFVDDVRALAAESPDFVYNEHKIGTGSGCHYYPTPGNPQGCLIGAALARQGVDTRSVSGTAFMVLHDLGAPTTICSWADFVQVGQDRGARWDVAVGRADSNAGEALA